MKTKLLKLSEVVVTSGTQIRASINHESVDEYAGAMTDGAIFPPIVVFHDGNEYILADGFHRVMAASRNGFKDIEADVRKGTKSDALKYALSANSTHGIKRTNADKRRSVVLALEEWPKFSDRQIAEICAVGKTMVLDARAQLVEKTSSHKCKDCGEEIDSRAAHFTGQCKDCHESNPPTRIGRDGKERKLPVKKETAAAAETTEPAPPRSSETDFVKACGNPPMPELHIEVSTVHYYAMLEELVTDALTNGTLKQLRSLSVGMAAFTIKIKQQIKALENA